MALIRSKHFFCYTQHQAQQIYRDSLRDSRRGACSPGHIKKHLLMHRYWSRSCAWHFSGGIYVLRVLHTDTPVVPRRVDVKMSDSRKPRTRNNNNARIVVCGNIRIFESNISEKIRRGKGEGGILSGKDGFAPAGLCRLSYPLKMIPGIYFVRVYRSAARHKFRHGLFYKKLKNVSCEYNRLNG